MVGKARNMKSKTTPFQLQREYREGCIKLCKEGSSEPNVGITIEAVRSEGHMEIELNWKSGIGKSPYVNLSSASFWDLFPEGESALDRVTGE